MTILHYFASKNTKEARYCVFSQGPKGIRQLLINCCTFPILIHNISLLLITISGWNVWKLSETNQPIKIQSRSLKLLSQKIRKVIKKLVFNALYIYVGINLHPRHPLSPHLVTTELLKLHKLRDSSIIGACTCVLFGFEIFLVKSS